MPLWTMGCIIVDMGYRVTTIAGLIMLWLLGVYGAPAMGFSLESPAFEHASPIPTKYSCEGADLSPPLRWQNPPEGTRAFVLLVEDPDAPAGTFTHWVVYDIPPDRRSIPEALPPEALLRDGTKQGINGFGNTGYGGPCPPRGDGTHRYYFTLIAVDVPTLGIKPGARKSEVLRAMEPHILGRAKTMGTYRR